MEAPSNGSNIPLERNAEKSLIKLDKITAGPENSPLTPDEVGLSTIYHNNEFWQLRVGVNNFDSKIEPFVIPNDQIDEVAIEHNIIGLDYLKGYVTIRSTRLGNLIYNDQLNTEFIFRGDGKDELYIDFRPLHDDPLKFPDEIWLTKLDFVVFDVTDVPNQDQLYKRIHFWHKPLHYMATRSTPFSTADYALDAQETVNQLVNTTNAVANAFAAIAGPIGAAAASIGLNAASTVVQSKEIAKKVRQLNNKDRQIYTGDAIRHILTSIGLKEFIDTDNWDRGSSKIFHTSYLNNSAKSEIEYILKNHTSEEGNHPCVFYYNRGINKYQLLPLTHFFDKAVDGKDQPGEYQLEHFLISPPTGLDDINVAYKTFAPVEGGDRFDRDIANINYNIIPHNEYKLYDMSGYDSMTHLISKPVHTYDHRNKEFKTFISDNDISNVKQYFEDNYTSKLYPKSRNSPLFILNKDKTDNVVTHHDHVPYENISSESLLNYGRNYIAQSAVFLNLAIEFDCIGSSHRHPGRFIGIDKFGLHTDNKYDYKLLGQWMVTSIKFVYKQDRMTNYISAVKTNTYGDLKINEDV